MSSWMWRQYVSLFVLPRVVHVQATYLFDGLTLREPYVESVLMRGCRSLCALFSS